MARECDCLYCDFSEEMAYQKVAERLRSSAGRPQAVFCFSDLMALGAMRAVQGSGAARPRGYLRHGL